MGDGGEKTEAGRGRPRGDGVLANLPATRPTRLGRRPRPAPDADAEHGEEAGAPTNGDGTTAAPEAAGSRRSAGTRTTAKRAADGTQKTGDRTTAKRRADTTRKPGARATAKRGADPPGANGAAASAEGGGDAPSKRRAAPKRSAPDRARDATGAGGTGTTRAGDADVVVPIRDAPMRRRARPSPVTARDNGPRPVRAGSPALAKDRAAERARAPHVAEREAAVPPPAGAELFTTAIRATGELANIGFTLWSQAVRRSLRRFTRP